MAPDAATISWLEGMPPFLVRAVEITIAGGAAMTAIWLVAFIMCGLGVNIWVGMLMDGLRPRSDANLREWLREPSSASGPVPELITASVEARSAESVALTFGEFRARELEPFDRQLRLMKVCVGLAPLLGLFGTVTGMLATFAALASGAGGEQTMGAIAKGISEALITTETGLVVALPGLFLQYHLARKKRGFEVFLDHAESICRRHATA